VSTHYALKLNKSLFALVGTQHDPQSISGDAQTLGFKDFKLISKAMPKSFWYLNLCCITFYWCTVGFLPICSDLLQTKYYPGDPLLAGSFTSIPDTIALVILPVMGYFAEKYSLSRTMLVSGGVLLVVAHLLFATSFQPVFGIMLLLGVGYSAFSSVLYAMLADSVPESKVSTAFGLNSALLNASFVIAPLFIAAVTSFDLTYASLEFCFALVALAGTCSALQVAFSTASNLKNRVVATK
jgi:hypothetical protein